MHLGNWEFGAPLLTQRGVKLQVITMAEPEARLTEFRQAARARWGIETIALGDHPFAAVEVIRRLEANNAIALLMDRPPAATAAPVNLFGRRFMASISAAELARASGCAILPVYLPRTSQGYTAHILPEISYDRRLLGNREARIELTQRIVASFEPPIRLYLNQCIISFQSGRTDPGAALQRGPGRGAGERRADASSCHSLAQCADEHPNLER